MKKIFAIFAFLIAINTISYTQEHNQSITKYIAPALKIATGLGGLALTAYTGNALLKSTEISTAEFKAAYMAPYATRTTQTIAEEMFKRLAGIYLTNNLLLLPFTAATSIFFLASGINDAVKVYKQR